MRRNLPRPVVYRTRYSAHGSVALTIRCRRLRSAPVTAAHFPRAVSIQRPVRRHRHRVLEVRRQAAVPRHRGPAVRAAPSPPACPRSPSARSPAPSPRPAAARVRARRSWQSAAPRAAAAPMPWPTNSRTTENPCASTCCLHRVADVRHPAAGLHLRRSPCSSDSCGHPQQRRRRPPTTSPTGTRHRRVAVVPVELHAHVERDDVARRPAPAAPTGCRAPPRSFTDAHSVAG